MKQIDENVVADLISHAESFLNQGLWCYTGYFPNNHYGKVGEDYYQWSKRAYELIKRLQAHRSEAE